MTLRKGKQVLYLPMSKHSAPYYGSSLSSHVPSQYFEETSGFPGLIHNFNIYIFDHSVRPFYLNSFNHTTQRTSFLFNNALCFSSSSSMPPSYGLGERDGDDQGGKLEVMWSILFTVFAYSQLGRWDRIRVRHDFCVRTEKAGLSTRKCVMQLFSVWWCKLLAHCLQVLRLPARNSQSTLVVGLSTLLHSPQWRSLQLQARPMSYSMIRVRSNHMGNVLPTMTVHL